MSSESPPPLLSPPPLQLTPLRLSGQQASLISCSSLSPYAKIPRIGDVCKYVPRPPSEPAPNTVNPRVRHRTRHKTAGQPIELAIRVPDGRRLQHVFSSDETINDIVAYIRSEDQQLANDVYLSTGESPKRQFFDMTLTLEQANICTRTTLFIDRY
jgi:hypothetical protein